MDAHVALLSVVSFNFISFPFGVATAATIRVGNLLGAGRANTARLASWLAVGLGASSMALCAVVMFAFRRHLAAIFIDDAAVSDVVAHISLIGCAMEIADGTMGTAQGALRGIGRQASLMVYNAVGFWGVGVVSGYLLTFRAGLGVAGLWYGFVAGIVTTGALNIAALLRVDWAAEAERAAGGRVSTPSEGVLDPERAGLLAGATDEALPPPAKLSETAE